MDFQYIVALFALFQLTLTEVRRDLASPLEEADTARAVQILLEKGADNAILPEGSKSLIDIAAEANNVEMLKAINDMKLAQNITNQHRLKPRHVASEPSITKNLIKIDFSINNETALYLISDKGSLELVRRLFQRGAAVDTQDDSDCSGLMIAVKNSKEAIASVLSINEDDANSQDEIGRTALHHVAGGGCAGIVRTLLHAGAIIIDRENNSYTPAINNMPVVIQLVGEKGTELIVKDSDGNEIFYLETHNGHVTVVKHLLHAGANINIKDKKMWTALHYAADRGHTAVVNALLDARAEVYHRDTDRRTALHYAAQRGHTAVVNALLHAGTDVNVVDNDERTALHYAAQRGNIAVVKAFLDAGAWVNKKDKYQWTALHVAADRGHTAVVKALLVGGAKVNETGQWQCTALHYAARKGHTAVMAALMDRGADLDSMANGHTPLMEAALYGNLEAMQLLVYRGAQVNAKNEYGLTALRYASINIKNSTAVADYLRSRGGV